MTVPSFLATEFAFTQLTGISDVQGIMDAIATLLTSTITNTVTEQWPNGQRWTNVSGTTYKSPTDAGGRYMQIVLTRSAANQMRTQVSDTAGQLADGILNISSGNAQVNIFGGPGHLYAEALNGSTWELTRAFMADPTPEPLASDLSSYVYATSWRTSGNVAQSPNFLSWQYRFTGGTLSNAVLFNYGALAVPWFPPQASSTNTHLMTQAGSNISVPYYTAIPSANGVDDWKPSGKLFQVLLVDSNLTQGSEITIPIDTGVNGVFRITHQAATRSMLFAVRKA